MPSTTASGNGVYALALCAIPHKLVGILVVLSVVYLAGNLGQSEFRPRFFACRLSWPSSGAVRRFRDTGFHAFTPCREQPLVLLVWRQPMVLVSHASTISSPAGQAEGGVRLWAGLC